MRGNLRDGIEPLEIVDARDHFIVIAANDMVTMPGAPLHNRRWIGIVAHQIAAADYCVVFVLRIGENGREGFEICVEIAKNQEAHRRKSVISGGEPRRIGIPMVPMPEFTYTDEAVCVYKPFV